MDPQVIVSFFGLLGLLITGTFAVRASRTSSSTAQHVGTTNGKGTIAEMMELVLDRSVTEAVKRREWELWHEGQDDQRFVELHEDIKEQNRLALATAAKLAEVVKATASDLADHATPVVGEKVEVSP